MRISKKRLLREKTDSYQAGRFQGLTEGVQTGIKQEKAKWEAFRDSTHLRALEAITEALKAATHALMSINKQL